MDVCEVIDNFLNFFKQRDHVVKKSSSIVSPEKDLLFVNAGIIPFKSYFFSGSSESLRFASTQECVRTVDIDEIGKSDTHLTFFRMNGNFSFNNYFRETAVEYALEYLLNFLKLPKDRLHITIHSNDSELITMFSDFERENIVLTDENTWSTGTSGPFGRCLEFYYDFGEKYGVKDVNNRLRFLEIWNIVFVDSISDERGRFLRKAQFTAIDTGTGVERMFAVLNNRNSIFALPPFDALLGKLGELAGRHGDNSFLKKVIVDHSITAMKIISSGVKPSNILQGYVLRKLLRKIFVNCGFMNIDISGIRSFNLYMQRCLSDNKHRLTVSDELITEMNSVESNEFKAFNLVYRHGIDTLFKRVKNKSIHGDDLFYLHDTLGFNIDLSTHICDLHGISVDIDGFNARLAVQKTASKKTKKITGVQTALNKTDGKTEIVKAIECTAKVLFLHGDKTRDENTIFVVFDKTPLLPESGGSISDSGSGVSENVELKISSIIKNKDTLYHECQIVRGELSVGDVLKLRVDARKRFQICQSHTAAHIIKGILEKKYSAVQNGSKNKAGSLTFDFSTPSERQIDAREIEIAANRHIALSKEIRESIVEHATALSVKKSIGVNEATVFQKTDPIRLVEIDGVSKELCIGLHVDNTSKLQMIMISKLHKIEQSTYRIEATVGEECYRFYREMLDKLNNTATVLEIKDMNPLSINKSLNDRVKKLNSDLMSQQAYMREYVLEIVDDFLKTEYSRGRYPLRIPLGSLSDNYIFKAIVRKDNTITLYESDKKNTAVRLCIINPKSREYKLIDSLKKIARRKWSSDKVFQFIFDSKCLDKVLSLYREEQATDNL